MKRDPLKAALRLLVKRAGGVCENYLQPLGECFKSGRKANAEFLADRACTACVADRALKAAENN